MAALLEQTPALHDVSKEIQLYDASSIDQLDWPTSEEAQYAKKFLPPLIKKGVHAYVGNIQADLYALKLENLVLPVLVAQDHYDNSWVCSPQGHYIGNGRAQIDLIGNPFLQGIVKGVLSQLDRVCRAGKINSVVYVNHWLFATDLYSKELSQKEIDLITAELTKRFPDHAIAFRSLNPTTTAPLLQMLRQSGYQTIASRQVYFTKTQNPEIFKTRILKSDLKLWKETPYKIVDEVKPEECPRLLELYQKLYVKQRLSTNPQFNLDFMKLLYDNKLLKFKVLKVDDKIEGVAGYLTRDGVMLCPFFGYDKSHPNHNVIYRLLNTALMLEAQKEGLIFHQSAGASFYKKIRRAEGCLESIGLYTRHLPAKQQFAWGVLRAFINTFAPRYMRKY